MRRGLAISEGRNLADGLKKRKGRWQYDQRPAGFKNCCGIKRICQPR